MLNDKKYGVMSNLTYIMRNVVDLNHVILAVMILFIVSSSVAQLAPVFFPRLIIDEIITGKRVEALVCYALIFGLLTAVSNAVKSSTNINLFTYLDSLRQFMNLKASKKYMSLNYESLEDPTVMDLLKRGEMAFDDYRTGVCGMISRSCQMSANAIATITTSAVLLFLNPIVVVITVSLSLVTYAVNINTRKHEMSIVDMITRYTRILTNMIAQMTNPHYAKDIRIYDMPSFLLSKLKKAQTERYKLDKRVSKAAMCRVLANVLVFFGQEAVFYVLLCIAVFSGKISVGQFVLYTTALRTFVVSLNGILDDVSFCYQQNASVNHHRAFMELDDNIDAGVRAGLINLPEICFELLNVGFKYPGSDKYVLKDVSLKINNGDVIAIVGLNGAGKSTLIKLLTRLYEPSEGEILLNGANILEFSKQEYYELFSTIFQDISLFAFSVGENVSMRSKGQYDEARVKKALSDSGLWEKIKDLSTGLDTPMLKVIEPDGVDFSGGEIQKLAMARSLYKNAPIVILDEPTSALDPVSEEKFYSQFRRLSHKKTILFISHRLSSTKFCDRILLLEEGRIVEDGTHKELIAAGKKYCELYEIQSQYYKEGACAD
ncbi:MAG: ABC transporter ATP-binding protein/permease [Clostridiales bacterium]|nr:ABC transporter ATP-binding protein/permease [Clostridiales bacterium]